MNSRILTIGILAAIAGLTGGFLLANGLNRSTLNALKTQLEQRKPDANAAPGKPGDLAVDPEEIKAKIAEADANPTDVAFQKSYSDSLISIISLTNTPSANVASKNGLKVFNFILTN